MYDNISISFKYHQLSLWNMWISQPVVFGDHVHGLSLNQKNEISRFAQSITYPRSTVLYMVSKQSHPRVRRMRITPGLHGALPQPLHLFLVRWILGLAEIRMFFSPWTTCLWVENHDCLQWKAVANNQGIRCGKVEHIAIRCCCPRFQELKQ